MLAAIEWDKIGELLYVAPLAGIAVAITYALMIVGWARASEARRDGAGGVAVAYSVLGTVATLAFLAVVVYGVTIIIKK
jgi:TRAP-type mannitol/chloroaromatic compound transport system permease small subunit